MFKFNFKMTIKVLALFIMVLFILQFSAAAQEPFVEIGNITRIKGMRQNQLIGYGIVVGLNGSGDSNRSQSTVQSVANMLQNFGIYVDSGQVASQNIAAVMVTGKLPPIVHSGDQIDVTVSSIGDADSLQGGTLLMTPLKAPNGEVFASAQGAVSIGGYNISSGGSTQRENHPTVGRIPGGAMVEKELLVNLNGNSLTYVLDTPNFETAGQIAEMINSQFSSQNVARAQDSSTVNIKVPESYSNRVVEFIAEVNNIQVRPGLEAKVIIDERTGTVVFSHNVRISTVAVAHGNLSVKITTDTEVSQPPPLSGGETEVTEDVQIEVEDGEGGNMMVVGQQTTIEDLVTALNAIGATPRDIISIIQKIKAAGALHAKLEII